MTTLREAAQQALEALEYHVEQTRPIDKTGEAITALRAALEQRKRHVSYVCPQCYWSLEQPEQEPVAWQGVYDKTDLYYRKPVQGDVRPLYTHPPRRDWRGLTDSERAAVQFESFKRGLSPLEFMELHEVKLKERNV